MRPFIDSTAGRATTARDAHALASLLTYAEWSPDAVHRDLGREVVQALRAMGAPAAPALAEILAEPRRGRAGRMVAAWLLGRIDRPVARDALDRAARDSDAEVAGAARKALGRGRRLETAAA